MFAAAPSGPAGARGAESESVRIRNLLVIGLLLTALGLSACGRRGPLEEPPGAGSNDDKPTILDPIIQ